MLNRLRKALFAIVSVDDSGQPHLAVKASADPRGATGQPQLPAETGRGEREAAADPAHLSKEGRKEPRETQKGRGERHPLLGLTHAEIDEIHDKQDVPTPYSIDDTMAGRRQKEREQLDHMRLGKLATPFMRGFAAMTKSLADSMFSGSAALPGDKPEPPDANEVNRRHDRIEDVNTARREREQKTSSPNEGSVFEKVSAMLNRSLRSPMRKNDASESMAPINAPLTDLAHGRDSMVPLTNAVPAPHVRPTGGPDGGTMRDNYGSGRRTFSSPPQAPLARATGGTPARNTRPTGAPPQRMGDPVTMAKSLFGNKR